MSLLAARATSLLPVTAERRASAALPRGVSTFGPCLWSSDAASAAVSPGVARGSSRFKRLLEKRALSPEPSSSQIASAGAEPVGRLLPSFSWQWQLAFVTGSRCSATLLPLLTHDTHLDGDLAQEARRNRAGERSLVGVDRLPRHEALPRRLVVMVRGSIARCGRASCRHGAGDPLVLIQMEGTHPIRGGADRRACRRMRHAAELGQPEHEALALRVRANVGCVWVTETRAFALGGSSVPQHTSTQRAKGQAFHACSAQSAHAQCAAAVAATPPAGPVCVRRVVRSLPGRARPFVGKSPIRPPQLCARCPPRCPD